MYFGEMPRQNFNVDVKIGGRKKCKVRKRGCSSSSSSSLMANYGLKRTLLMGKRVGTTTPVPMWKTMGSFSKPASLENDKAFNHLSAAASGGDDKAKELSVSARKLAATLWEIDGMSSVSPRVKREDLEETINEIDKEQRVWESSKLGSMALALSDLFHSPVTEVMDQDHHPKLACHRRLASAGSQKLLQGDCDLGGAKSYHNCLVETQNHARSPCRHIIDAKNRFKDVYNGLVTSKELLKVMSRLSRIEQQNSTTSSLFTALKFELDRAFNQVGKLILEQGSDLSDIDILIKRFEEEKIIWNMKEQERIRTAIVAIAGELEMEKKLRRQTERLNKKLGNELAETKASLLKTAKELENERRAQKLLEQACDELARGIGEDRAEVEELKRQSAKVREEVEKEREMLQLADVLREERVQMKLSEAKYQFEEKSALIDKLRNELETYLKSKMGEQQPDGSPSYDKIKELKKYLRETLPGSNRYEEKEEDDKVDEDEDDDSSDSDLHSIELSMDDISKSFQWNDDVRNSLKRNSVDKSRGRKSTSERIKTNGIERDFTKQETLDAFDKRGMFEFASQSWKRDSEDEIERYNMIKDLRDHIVSSARMDSTQDLASPSKSFGQQSVSSKDLNGVTWLS